MVNPPVNPFAFTTSGALWGANTGLGFGSSMGLGVGGFGLGSPFVGGPRLVTPDSFATGPGGRELTQAERNQLYQQYLQQQQLQAAQAQRFLNNLKAAAVQAQQNGGGQGPQHTMPGGLGSVPAGGHIPPAVATPPAHRGGTTTITPHNR
jgi:hypothetical protein